MEQEEKQRPVFKRIDGNKRSSVGDAVELLGLLGVLFGVVAGIAGSPAGWGLVGGAVLLLMLAQLIHIRWLLANRRD